jgi:hypothetical protein
MTAFCSIGLLAVQVCDATMINSSTEGWNIKKYLCESAFPFSQLLQ